MEFNFSQNNIKAVFEITENGMVILRDFGTPNAPHVEIEDKNLKWYSIADVHVTGENPNDHHGAKHTGASGSVSLKYKAHRYFENEYGNKLEFDLSDDKLAVTVHYQFYKDIAAIRAWLTLTNISKEAVGLEYISSFSYTGLPDAEPRIFIPHNAWYREAIWCDYSLSDLGFERTSRFSQKRIAQSNTGTWSTKEYLPMGAISDINTTLMWQIESNGSWQWEISDIANMLYLKAGGPSEQENGWYKELKAGESFESVKVCVTVGNSFDDSLEQMTKYRRIIFENNPENAAIPVIFNDYMNCLMANPTTEKLLPIIDMAADAGADYFCVDAGWYADGSWWESVGEWMPSSQRFPNGIKEVFDYIRKKGMISGLWLEIEVMGINCPLVDSFEDECFFMRHSKKVIDHSRYQLDFRHPKVRDFATKVIDRVVGEYGIGYIKMDYNIEAGLGTEVNSDSFGDGLLEHNRAYLAWIDEIKTKYPSLIIENCSSGGVRMDYAMLAKHHLQSTSDQTDYRHTAIIAANAATAVLPEQAAVWSYTVANDDENAASFNMINAMLTRIHLSGEIAKLSKEQLADIKEGIERYKEYRSLISSFIPFYPLGLNTYNRGWACVGYKANKECFLAVWRLDHKENLLSVPTSSVKDVEIVYPRNTKCKIKATEDSIAVILPDNYSAVIIRYTVND